MRFSGLDCFSLDSDDGHDVKNLALRSTPHPVTVTTRIITFLAGNPYKPSFATVTGWGVDPTWAHRTGICLIPEQLL